MESLDAQTLEPGAPLRLALDELPEEGHARKAHYRLAGETLVREVLLVRVGGALHALDSLCPHAGGRLAEGPLLDGEHVHCPLHLYRFRPADGQAVGVPCPPATTLRVREERGEVFVEVGAQ